MGDLDHRRRALSVTFVGQFVQTRHDGVVMGMQIAGGRHRLLGAW
jgi:hypothetical protein